MELPSLSEYIKNALAGVKPGYENEAVANAILDYLSMKGEFRTEDLKTIYGYGYCAGDFICDDDTPEESITCIACGFHSDVEGDVIRAEGCCPRCGKETIVVYGKLMENPI